MADTAIANLLREHARGPWMHPELQDDILDAIKELDRLRAENERLLGEINVAKALFNKWHTKAGELYFALAGVVRAWDGDSTMGTVYKMNRAITDARAALSRAPSAVSASDPAVVIAGIRQFGLAPDGSDLRDLEAAIARLRAPERTVGESK